MQNERCGVMLILLLLLLLLPFGSVLLLLCSGLVLWSKRHLFPGRSSLQRHLPVCFQRPSQPVQGKLPLYNATAVVTAYSCQGRGVRQIHCSVPGWTVLQPVWLLVGAFHLPI
jgi:hypothetical protein